MTIETLITLIKTDARNTDFEQVINTINEHYDYTPSRFSNGIRDEIVINEAGTNEGSCKIFSFAQMNQLNKDETLNCFGKYYRDDVLNHPDKSDHANIRSFMIHGWDGINFEQTALRLK